ncbi:type I-E CRISPR-associated protein Cse1/CasA [Nocardia tengchongensis]|uniref:type I-E CRISPR-associated protein Cse1/CasA n=1 Tax=Nocardia tengchongensis TaxID=2055889 RepID=UPI0036A530D0
MVAHYAEFDLLEEPWILGLDREGGPCAVSLRSVFHRAHELSSLAGELPTQSYSLLRLLLAVLRRSVRDHPGSAVDVWSRLWSSQTLPLKDIDSYLDEYHDRFRLFDPTAPFFQVAGLNSAAGVISSLDRLIADVPNGEKYFTTRGGAGIDRLDFGEAARWLVHTHSFDPSGIKTGAVGDSRVKGGKGYPIGVAWTGNLGGIFLEGATLRETLLLNLVLLDINGDRFNLEDLPPWEREPDRAAVDPRRRPAGPADLCTWQSRRIRLVSNDTHVTGVVLCNGDPLEPFNQHLLEPMTAWRFSETQTKKAGQARHYPLAHDPQRALWRGLTSLLREVGSTSATSDRTIAPSLLEWMCRLLDDEVLDPAHLVRLHAVGMQYINNQSVIGDIFDDTIGFRVALLSTNPALRTAAVNAVQVAENAIDALAGLAGNLAVAAGGEADSARTHAREQGYFAMESPYRQWLATLHPDGAIDVYDRGWQQLVRRAVEPLGRDFIASAGMPAWVGREIRGSYLDANLAGIWFRGRLKKLLPAAYADSTDDGGIAA